MDTKVDEISAVYKNEGKTYERSAVAMVLWKGMAGAWTRSSVFKGIFLGLLLNAFS